MHASEPLTFLMRIVTATGYEQFFVAVVIVVMFGINFRKGVILFQLILWTAILTELCKSAFNLPRPCWVDPVVRDFETDAVARAPVPVQSAAGLWDPLPPATIEVFRSQHASFGFPSGHVASAAVFWGSIGWIFNRRLFRWLAPPMIVFMALSRMYLGRHFLADVIGGALLGMIVLIAGWFLLRRLRGELKLFARDAYFSAPQPLVMLVALVAAPVAVIFTGIVPVQLGGYLLGMNVALIAIIWKGIPEDHARISLRLARIGIAALLFVGCTAMFTGFVHAFGITAPGPVWVFLQGFVPALAVGWGGVFVSRTAGLYGSSQPERPA